MSHNDRSHTAMIYIMTTDCTELYRSMEHNREFGPYQCMLGCGSPVGDLICDTRKRTQAHFET